MANELKHKSVGVELTQAEYEAIGAHVFDSQATGDILYASTATQLSKLAIGSTGNILSIVSGVPAWIGGSSGSETSYTEGTPLVSIYATCGNTGSTNAEPFYVKSVMTGVGGTGGRTKFHLYTNVALGGWANALKAYTEFGASGRITGLGSAFCAELLLSAGTTQGTYAPLESELVADSAVSTGSATSFLHCNIAGSNSTGKTTINTNGYFFEIGDGIADTVGGMFEAEVNTDSMSMTHVLRVKIDGTAYFIPLNTAKTF